MREFASHANQLEKFCHQTSRDMVGWAKPLGLDSPRVPSQCTISESVTKQFQLITDHRQPRHQPFSHSLVMGKSRTNTTICFKLFEDGQDGREMVSNYDEIEAQEKLEILGVKMHLLPSGSSYYVNANRTDDKKMHHFLMQ